MKSLLVALMLVLATVAQAEEAAHLECFNDSTTGERKCYVYVFNGCGLVDLAGTARMNVIDQRHKINNGPAGFLAGVVVCKPAPTAPASVPAN